MPASAFWYPTIPTYTREPSCHLPWPTEALRQKLLRGWWLHYCSPLDPEKGVTSGVSRETDSTWLLWTNIQAIQTTFKNSPLALIRIAGYSWAQIFFLPTLGTAVDPCWNGKRDAPLRRSVIGDHRSYQRMGWTGEVSEITQTSSRDSRWKSLYSTGNNSSKGLVWDQSKGNRGGHSWTS